MKRIIDIPEEDYNYMMECCPDLTDLMNIYEQIKNSTPINECEAEDCISRQQTLRMLTNSIGKSNTYIQTQVLKMPSAYSEDAISREKVLEKIKWIKNNNGFKSHINYCALYDDIDTMPSVYPKSDKPTIIDWNNCHTEEHLKQATLDSFITYAKKNFGIELTVKKSDNPDTVEKLFGGVKAENCTNGDMNKER